MAAGNPLSFLNVDRAEILLPEDTDIYSDAVYAKAASTLDKMVENYYLRDETPCYYLYQETMQGRSQMGIVGCASVDDYQSGVIKKHENTVAAKEADRIRHVDKCNANTGIIFLAFREHEALEKRMAEISANEEPVYDFVSDDGIGHKVWLVKEDADIELFEKSFEEIPALYIADGHHRAASAVRVGEMRRNANPDYSGKEEFNFFLAAAFPASALSIWDYNRVVKDLGGMTPEEFLEKIRSVFDVLPLPEPSGDTEEELKAVKPAKVHDFSLYLAGRWYLLRPLSGTFDADDVVERLDVSILQNNLLTPVLGIKDPRTDSRISFVGGIRGLGELKKRVDEGEAAAFALYPTQMEALMAIADEGRIMPPKSTWFEPKLRSGLFIHYL